MSVAMMSVDVEDWFHVENLRSAIPRRSWEEQPQRVVRNTTRILDLFDDHDTRATFFVLGWVAERHPELVKDIEARGHEVASHGHSHRLIYNQDPDAFRRDLQRSKETLESIIGESLSGYRAPNFSINETAMQIIDECGFIYDSSFFPSSYHDRYGSLDLGVSQSGLLRREDDGLLEVPIPTLNRLGLQIPWGGGGYFRALPYSLFRWGVRRILEEQGGYVFYLHPWEIDPDQPRVDGIPIGEKIRHYLNLHRTFDRLDRLLDDFNFVSIRDGLKRLKGGSEADADPDHSFPTEKDEADGTRTSGTP